MLELFTFLWEIRKLLVLRITEKRKNSSVGKKKKGSGGRRACFLGGCFLGAEEEAGLSVAAVIQS